MSHVFLIGFMASGKSAVGSVVAERTGTRLIDLDGEVEARLGLSVPDIFERDGEAAFRAAERAALLSMEGREPAVVSCGGGIVLDPANREVLARSGKVFWLRVSGAVARARAGEESGRPLMDGRSPEQVDELVSEREPLYGQVSDVRVDTDGLTVPQVAERVLAELGAWPS